MANVWDAMKKHEAEKAEQAEKAEKAEQEQADPPGEASPPVEPKADRNTAGVVTRAAAASKASAAEEVAVQTTAPAKEPPAKQPPPAAPGPPKVTPRETQTILPEVTFSNGSPHSELLVAQYDRGGTTTEQYRALRTSLLAQNPDERFCYLITSADAGEGKTITCANLAVVMAERVDRRTILIDCDLRKRMLATYLNTEQTPGMSDVLDGRATLKESVQPTAYPNLFFLPAGKAIEMEVAELIGRPELEETVLELRRQYDYIIFDTPPINVVSDAGMLGRATGEALLVVRMNKTRRESVEKAIRLLRAANVKPAGIVLTHRRFLIPSYLYRYS